MATVYISASDRYKALYFKELLERHGHTVVSTWHNEPMKRSREIDNLDKVAIASQAKMKIKLSTHLLILDDPDMVPGGKFVDVGLALGMGKKVFLVGRRENIKMYDPDVTQFDCPEDVLKDLP